MTTAVMTPSYNLKMEKLLKAAGFTQRRNPEKVDIQAFSRAAELSYTTAYGIVNNGIENQKVDTLRKVADALEIPVADLLD